MLVLSRKVDERIRIGHDVVITVVEIRSDGKVRLGFEAPIDVEIHREEIYHLAYPDGPNGPRRRKEER